MADERVEKVDEERERTSSEDKEVNNSAESAAEISTDETSQEQQPAAEPPGEEAAVMGDTDSPERGCAGSSAEDAEAEAQAPPPIDETLETIKKISDKLRFIVFHPSHFKGITIRSYLHELGFQDVEIVSDLQAFTRALITAVSGLTDQQVVFSVFSHEYKVLRFWMLSDDFAELRQRFPTLLDCPALAFAESESEIAPEDGIDPQCIIPMDKTLVSNRKKIIEFLNIEC